MADHVLIAFDESLTNLTVQHAAHCLLYYTELDSNSNQKLHFLLMQIRTDGTIGFPGGIVDEDIAKYGSQAVLDGLRRELLEEINFSASELSEDNYVCSHFSEPKNLICHFFAHKLTQSAFQHIEQNHTKARDFPSEQLGLFRIPLWTLRNDNQLSDRNLRFWRKFIDFPFIGNSREQLMTALEQQQIIQAETLKSMMQQEVPSAP
ncbi:U8 snoRNA-decapping enzyme [Halotydeus destructor]|nr:U8 snoRNA-decapping enzyme [Halotydeus destructor]